MVLFNLNEILQKEWIGINKQNVVSDFWYFTYFKFYAVKRQRTWTFFDTPTLRFNNFLTKQKIKNSRHCFVVYLLLIYVVQLFWIYALTRCPLIHIYGTYPSCCLKLRPRFRVKNAVKKNIFFVIVIIWPLKGYIVV